MATPAGFSLRIVQADSYMSKPIVGLDAMHSEVLRTRSQRAPVIRIFGSTPAGQTACMHVHRVFPYIYVPYDGTAPTQAYIYSFAECLNRALEAVMASSNNGPTEPTQARSAPHQHVFKIIVVKGIPFYGYYGESVLFLKIFFYSPQSVKRATKLLLSGAILRKSFQPYEAHIPYILQFFMDYNLQGMNFINVTAVQFRIHDSRGDKTERSKLLSRSTSSEQASQSSTTFHPPNTFAVRQETVEQMANDIPRSTTCELEVDVVCEDVLNREEIEIKIGTNPGLEAIWRDENQRRAQRSLPPLVGVPSSQERSNIVPAKSEQYFQRRLATKCRVANPLPKSKENDEVAETVAMLVDEAEVMNRNRVLFGVSSQSVDMDVDSSFHLTLHNDPDTHTSSLRSFSQSSMDSSQAEMEELLRGLAGQRQVSRSTQGSSPSQTPEARFNEDHTTSVEKHTTDRLSTTSPKTTVGSVPLPLSVAEVSASEATSPEALVDILNHPPTLTTPAAPAGVEDKAKNVFPSFEQLPGISTTSKSTSKLAMDSRPSRKKHLLRPARRFPSQGFIKKTATDHQLALHSNATTVYSDVYELIEEDLKTKEATAHKESKHKLPIERLLEFGSSCIELGSSSLFATGMDHAAGWDDHVGRKPKPMDKKEKEQQPEARIDEAEDRRLDWLQVGGNRQELLWRRSTWKVRLTPLLPFPKLSSMDKIMDSLRTADAGEGTNVTPASAMKARENPQFKELIGDMCGNVAKLNLDVKSPTAESEDGKCQVLQESENLLLLSMELQCQTTGSQAPDASRMPIRLISYALMTDTGDSPADGIVGYIYVTNGPFASMEREKKRFPAWLTRRETFRRVDIEDVLSEVDLINRFIALVQRWDPDIVVGYEIQLSSWGYLIQRGATLGIDMLHALSRFLKPPVHPTKTRKPNAVAAWEARKMSEIHIVGRVVLNLWRLMRSELTLTVYSLENVVHHVLKRRLYLYSHETMTAWLSRPPGDIDRWRAIEYVIIKASFNMKLLAKLDILRQTSEFSRLFGIQFYDTLTRGSQYRVESMMLRLAKPFSYVPVSPTAPQLVAMVAPESLPLILEPESRFYYDPVIVLDFQSLYPSIVIAYNYCYSTCLGRVELLASPDYIKFGCTAMKVHNRLWMQRNLQNLTFSPNGVAFVKSNVRRGIVPQMLEEILNTRIMVKKATTGYRDSPVLKKLLHARQLGLKLIANVTYGYTSASFSGRMPCVEIADSIVAKARETLESSMKFIEANAQWDARVIYGDTDSMFVHLPGRSKEEAFRIGRQMETAITDMNPKPMKLKFEKVYMPCILQTKKRYCGYMYETEDQLQPVFDAKGIETVRRDTCPLVAKTLRQSICMLFDQDCDITSLKHYISGVLEDVLTGKVSLQDFVFAKEYRGRQSYKPGARVPALEIAKKVTVDNGQAEPRIGQRVPYVLVYGKPHERLMALIRQPQEVLGDLTLKPHGFYYCSRQLVPVLNRILLLLGLDTGKWLLQIQKRLLNVQKDSSLASLYGDVMYYRRFVAQVFSGTDHSDLLFGLGSRMQDGWALQRELITEYGYFERQQYQLKQICGACMGRQTSMVECQSFDCPVLSQHYKVLSRSARLLALQQQLTQARPDVALADLRDEQQENDWLMDE